jgi:hypothetical protein
MNTYARDYAQMPVRLLSDNPLPWPVDADGKWTETAIHSGALNAIRNSPELMREARGWVEDAFTVPEPIESWHPLSVLQRIDNYYSGGIVEFYLNSRSLTPVISYSSK